MRVLDTLLTAVTQIRAHKLRSFFTLLGIVVSVAFLVAVVAIIQGMNSYVRENVAGAVVGTNAFAVRRTPIRVGLFDDEELRRIRRRPRLTPADAEAVTAALPDADAVGLQSGWPTPQADIVWRDRTLGDVLIFGITPPFQVVQDYRFAEGRPLNEIDVRERRYVAVAGAEDGHVARLAHVDLVERPPFRKAVVLHHLEGGRDAEDEHVAERAVTPDDVRLRRRPARLEPYRLCVGEGHRDGLGVRRRQAGAAPDAAQLLVVEQPDADRRATHGERVRADHRT